MNNPILKQRWGSVDLYRAVIMWLILFESVYLFEVLHEAAPSGMSFLLQQFFHAHWIGLTFWDLIQPGFMFLAGVSIVLSMNKRMENGENTKTWILHILKRSLTLFILGVGLHWIYNEGPVFELQNVLTQLAVTTVITALFIRCNILTQFIVSLSLIVLTSIIYRIYNGAAPFLPGRNAGTAFDLFLSGHADSDHWVSLNFLPTAAHTMWGAITVQILLKDWTKKKKLSILVIGSLVLILLGMLLHLSGIEPMIKRISTASFVFVSGGISILILVFLHFMMDTENSKETAVSRFFSISGQNCILLYLISQIFIPLFLYDTVSIFTYGIAELFHIPEFFILILTSFSVLYLIGIFLKWLNKENIRIKI